ncbi:hypothetical protein SDJN03_20019, partial [Cucurbita argyrosperma subsp. sororia]
MQSSELDGDRRRMMNDVGEVAIDLQDTGRTTGENCRREIFHVNERARSEKDSEDGVDVVPPKPSSVNLDMKSKQPVIEVANFVCEVRRARNLVVPEGTDS